MPKTMGLLGKKIGMTRVYNQMGAVIPVTVIEAGPCKVLQVKSETKEGYNAIQVGFGSKRASRITKPLAGHFSKADTEGFYNIREFRIQNPEDFQVGQDISLGELFKTGDIIDVQGVSKGKGFQGVMKRHGFSGVGGTTHGQSNRLRAPGSIGQSSYPSRVFKGMRMAGRMGGNRVKLINLKVMKIIPEKNLLVVKGAVPGPNNSLVIIERWS